MFPSVYPGCLVKLPHVVCSCQVCSVQPNMFQGSKRDVLLSNIDHELYLLACSPCANDNIFEQVAQISHQKLIYVQ